MPRRGGNLSGTVRVRVAVVLTPEGFYDAQGWMTPEGTSSDEDLAEIALDVLGNYEEVALDHHRVVFVEADIPLPSRPEAVTVEGEVKP
jgi:hypothetical protein